jgi:hypothetical protein
MLVFVGIAALGCASLVAPSGFCAALWHLTIFGIFAFAIVAAIYRTDVRRASWVGFAIFGWLFLASERSGMVDMERVASVLGREALISGLDDVYRRQASRIAQWKIRQGITDPGGPNPQRNLARLTSEELNYLHRWLGESIFCASALLAAIVGGALGKWLYLSQPKLRAEQSA